MNRLKSLQEQIIDTKKLIDNSKQLLQSEVSEMNDALEFIIKQDEMVLSNLENEEKELLILLVNEKLPFSFQNAEDIIDHVYGETHLGSIDPKKIADELNIKVISDYNMIDGIGRSEFDGENIIITYKPTNQYRDKFTIAHELGHIFLHFTKGISYCFVDSQDISIDSANNTSYAPKLLKASRLSEEFNVKLEKEANKFAGNLLIPKKIISNLLKNIPRGQQLNATMVKDFFKVSKDVTRHCLFEYELINNGTIIDNLPNNNRKW